MIGEPLSKEWRLEHVKLGDKALLSYYKWVEEMDPDDDDPAQNATAAALIGTLVLVAQAHYQAANVRARLS